MMNWKMIGILSILFLFVGAMAGACEDFVGDDRYMDARGCYQDAEEWDKCVYYSLVGGRDAEIDWDFGENFAAKSMMLQFYRVEYWPPVDTGAYQKAETGSPLGLCLHHYGDEPLSDELEGYHEWLFYYTTRGGDAPFDMDAKILAMDHELFPFVPDEPVDNGDTDTGPKPPIGPIDGGDDDAPADYTLLIVVVVLLVLAAVGGGAVFLFMKMKKGKKSTHHTKDAHHTKRAHHKKVEE